MLHQYFENIAINDNYFSKINFELHFLRKNAKNN